MALSVVPLILGLVLAGVFWDWLTITEPGTDPASESGSTTVRNLGIVLAALVALPLAIWRGQSADRQAKATQQQAEAALRQAEAALRQAETAQEDLRNKRYEESAEMLGNDVLAVRLAGIYALQRLAQDHPWEYHIEVMKSLCAFVRNPTKDEGLMQILAERRDAAMLSRASPKPELREDVQAAMDAISACHARQLSLEERAGFQLDLRDADLRGASLPDANLSRALLAGAKLDGANLRRSILYRAYFGDAGLTDATLANADLRGATLLSAVLVSADLQAADLTPLDMIQTFLVEADLTDAELFYAKMDEVNLTAANLTGTKFTMQPHLAYTNVGPGEATGLTQEQLDHAISDPDKPPWLEGMTDPETGEQLVPPRNPAGWERYQRSKKSP